METLKLNCSLLMGVFSKIRNKMKPTKERLLKNEFLIDAINVTETYHWMDVQRNQQEKTSFFSEKLPGFIFHHEPEAKH